MRDSAQQQLSVQQTMEDVAAVNSRKRLKYLVIGGVVLLAAVVGVIILNAGRRATSMQFQTRKVQQGNLVMTVTATGNLAATNEVTVGSELSGIIRSLTADYNDIVTANQPLAYLDDTKYKAAVMKSRAEVASAKAGYEEALTTRNAGEKTLKRFQKTRDLTNGKMPSVNELEQAEADLERSTAAVASALAAIDIARASLKLNEADLQKTVIYSPINGIVLSRDVEIGQTVAASLQAPVLYKLAEDLRHMELQVDVDEADVGQIREGQSAIFTVDAYPDRSFEAQITQVRYNAETNSGVVTYKTLLKVENPDLLLRPGMTATATITVRKIEDTLLVPNTALRFTPPQTSVEGNASRGLLGSLMPGPRRFSRSNKRRQGGASDANDKTARVWVLKDGQPVPVLVEKQDTDGVFTSVVSKELREGAEVIVNAMEING